METFANVLESLAAIIVALVALYGLTSWRKEIREKKRYALAEEVLTTFYDTRDRIFHIRNPFALSSEGHSIQEDEAPDQQGHFGAAIVFERFNTHHEAFNKLRALKYRFAAHFGEENARPFDSVWGILDDILKSAVALNNSFRRKTQLSLEKYEKAISAIMSGEKNDIITIQVDKLIEQVEETCRPILQSAIKSRRSARS